MWLSVVIIYFTEHKINQIESYQFSVEIFLPAASRLVSPGFLYIPAKGVHTPVLHPIVENLPFWVLFQLLCVKQQ